MEYPREAATTTNFVRAVGTSSKVQIDHVVALAAAWVVLPSAAVDARRPGVVEETKRLIEEDGFRGIKLYPPLGYHPNDPLLRPLYAFAAELRDFAADRGGGGPPPMSMKRPATA